MATLLLVEDDPDVREILCYLLGATHQCHTADRAEQALECLDYETYDVVITDIAMPGLGGREVLRRVNERDPSVPVVIISGLAIVNRDELLKAGAFAFIQKPFKLREIEETVAQAVAYRQTVHSVQINPA